MGAIKAWADHLDGFRKAITGQKDASEKAEQPPPASAVGADGKLVWRVHGVDYDLEAFAKAHPGGELALRLGQGIDATQLLETYHSVAAVTSGPLLSSRSISL